MRTLVEQNVCAQVSNVSSCPVVKNAWRRGQNLTVHGKFDRRHQLNAKLSDGSELALLTSSASFRLGVRYLNRKDRRSLSQRRHQCRRQSTRVDTGTLFT